MHKSTCRELSLPMYGSRSLTDAIKTYLRQEYFTGDNQLKCDECDMKTDSIREMSFHDPPKILMIVMQSMLGSRAENETLDFNPWLDLPTSSDGETWPVKTRYSWVASLVHSGYQQNGHCRAFVKANDGKWYEKNDGESTLRSFFEVEANTPFLLFFVRDEDDWEDDIIEPERAEIMKTDRNESQSKEVT